MRRGTLAVVAMALATVALCVVVLLVECCGVALAYEYGGTCFGAVAEGMLIVMDVGVIVVCADGM